MSSKYVSHTPQPRPPHRGSQASVANEMPSPEVLRSAIHWLSAHRTPDYLKAAVDALIEQDRKALGVAA